jgi:TonB family protein
LGSGASGEATLEVRVAPSGQVVDVQVVQAHCNMGTIVTDALSSAASAAAAHWRFEAQRQETNVRLSFAFRMMPNGTPSQDLTAHFIPPYRVEVRAHPVLTETIRDPPNVPKTP